MSIAISSIKQHLGGRTNATDDFGTYFQVRLMNWGLVVSRNTGFLKRMYWNLYGLLKHMWRQLSNHPSKKIHVEIEVAMQPSGASNYTPK